MLHKNNDDADLSRCIDRPIVLFTSTRCRTSDRPHNYLWTGKVHSHNPSQLCIVYIVCVALCFRAAPVHGSDLLNLWAAGCDWKMMFLAAIFVLSWPARPKQKGQINCWSKMIDETFWVHPWWIAFVKEENGIIYLPPPPPDHPRCPFQRTWELLCQLTFIPRLTSVTTN